MRTTKLLVLPLLGVLLIPGRAVAQVSIQVAFGTRLGPEIGVSAYSQERMGNWRSNYRHWRPVTLYDVNGHYYRNRVRGARAVLVYSYDGEYFLPPQDQGWSHADTRYDYRRQPNEGDYGRARPYARGAAIDRRLGEEIGVLGYSEDRAGDWRKNVRRWTPVTVYEVNGKYYPNNGTGARPVQIYRYRNEYFLPPSDKKWVGFDKRFDYNHQPQDDDRGRVRSRP